MVEVDVSQKSSGNEAVQAVAVAYMPVKPGGEWWIAGSDVSPEAVFANVGAFEGGIPWKNCAAMGWSVIAVSIMAMASAPKFCRGAHVRKNGGRAEFQGYVCGEYSTAKTPDGLAVESEFHKGTVQIYPASALEMVGG